MGVKFYQWHLLGVGMWAGCVATEVIFDRVMEGQEQSVKRLASKVRYWTCMLIELPISTLAFLTGGRMISQHGRHPDTMLMAKAFFGTVAFVCNLGCFHFVRQRYLECSSAESVRSNECSDGNNKWLKRLSKGVAHSILAALTLGLLM